MRVQSITLPRFSRLPRLAGLADLLALYRQRKQLAALDALQLADIGLSPDQALAESRRPIWDAPPHWRL